MNRRALMVDRGGTAGFFPAIFAFKVIGSGDNAVGMLRSKP